MKNRLLALLFFALSLSLSGCLPRFSEPASVLESDQARATEQAANIAYHRMEIGKLQSGSYNTNVLADLELPQGVQWALIAFGDDSYTLRFSAQDIPDYAWKVTPQGVQLEALPTVEN